MKELLVVITSVNAKEAIRMFSSGVMLAISVFTASKVGRRSRER